MFCKNWGEQFQSEQAVMCVKCGVQKGNGVNFCHNCGQPVQPGSAVCLNCGVATQNTVAGPDAKSKMAAGLLGIFLGGFGVHNFYLGYTGKAVAQLLITLLTCGFGAVVSSVWGIIEGVLILTGSINTDGKGNPLKD